MVAKVARFLAPIALAAVAVGVYLIVQSTLIKHDVVATQSSTTVVTTRHAARHRPAAPKFYFVKSGDTLSAIASTTGVPQSRLEALNPAIATPPFNLQTGQRLRLRR
jgi:LysM repeat protein